MTSQGHPTTCGSSRGSRAIGDKPGTRMGTRISIVWRETEDREALMAQVGLVGPPPPEPLRAQGAEPGAQLLCAGGDIPTRMGTRGHRLALPSEGKDEDRSFTWGCAKDQG